MVTGKWESDMLPSEGLVFNSQTTGIDISFISNHWHGFAFISGDFPMRCPYCRHDETKVIDSRTGADFAIRRRRECLKCSRRFTTFEKIEDLPIKVIKKDGSRVPFNREKIREGLEKACYKRPVSEQQIESLISDTESHVYENYEREVPSRVIGELVIEQLRKLDQVAFVRFASVYREFKDVNDFVEELGSMLKQRSAQGK